MKYPIDYLRIAGINYKIELLSTEEMKGHLGLADFNNQKISINKETTEATQQIALIHEVIHILDKSFNIKLTEEQVIYTAQALVSLTNDNPEFRI
jgi:hypothetical protein